ncbi:hypothetical protein RB620_12260 [Paenibacillus sp. LHD-117]|uniref:hypothetical protein n=1 Tax=Paenibacillus sp. LHD-117 TaxID=3071412 RepID=UPI0027E0B1A6|nr:hypothetical protein [Paenibacillus sp. LHD-117]MDQ6420210.1 hypothetical protein [Paenibacillus sp. LHD-117]
MFVLLIVHLLTGCGKGEQTSSTYSVIGDIGSVEQGGAEVNDVEIDYVVMLTNIQPGSNPESTAGSEFTLTITENTRLYRASADKKTEADISALTQGERAEVKWRFANDHLIEAVEINVNGKLSIQK